MSQLQLKSISRNRILLMICLLLIAPGLRCNKNGGDLQGKASVVGKLETANRVVTNASQSVAEGVLNGEELIGTEAAAIETVEVDYRDVVGRGPEYYGVEYSWVDQDKTLFLQRIRRLHANVIRVQITQDVFEPENDNSDPSYSTIDFSRTLSLDAASGKTITYEKMFQSLVSEFPDMEFQINIWLSAKWNATDPNGYFGLGGVFPPKDYAEHREFVRALASWLVSKCGIQPDHLSFTFINEPNLGGFFVGTSTDLIRMARETRAALADVSPLIRMGGLDEVHGTSWSTTFYNLHPDSCCDMWTFHAYENGLPALWGALDGRIRELTQYGPVWVTEFADTINGSPDAQMDFSTKEAGLGFAALLGKLWPSGIEGIIHFRLSDTYADRFGGWVGHGLFADWRGTHGGGRRYKLFPSYWVFANVYRELGGGEIVATTSLPGLVVVGVRKTDRVGRKLAIMVTNPTQKNRTVKLQVKNFPTKNARVYVLNNLLSDKPVQVRPVSGKELIFKMALPPESSYMFVLRPNVW